MNILKVGDVAAALRVSEETVRLWCRTGVLPAYRPRSTKQYLINADEFDAWLKTRAVRETVKLLKAPRLDEDDKAIAERLFDDRDREPVAGEAARSKIRRGRNTRRRDNPRHDP